MQPLAPASMRVWIEFMRECTGLPAQAPVHPTNPRVVFANRAYSSGRSILTLGQVTTRPALGPVCPLMFCLALESIHALKTSFTIPAWAAAKNVRLFGAA